MRFVHTLRSLSFPAIVLGTALTLACGDGGPTAPDQEPSFAASGSPLSIEPRSLRLKCAVGSTCTGGIVIAASSSVTVHYQIEGEDFIINPSVGTCVQDSSLLGSCFLNVKVATTLLPGRRTATLVISENTTGTSLTVRLAARVF